MATSQTKRVLELIKRFNNGNTICIDRLINDPSWYNDGVNDPKPMSEKSIRRDLDVIKEYFPQSFELVRGEKGCYRAITTELYNNFLNEDVIALIVQAFNITKQTNLFESLKIDESHKRMLEDKIDKTKDCYMHISKPFESKNLDREILKTLEKAIQYKRHCTIEQNEIQGLKKYELKPYKILFMNENFYLVGENLDENYPFSIFRLSNIVSATFNEKQFHHNQNMINFIKQIQTPFPRYSPNFQENMIRVLVEVAPVKAKLFTVKKHLQSQNIEQKLEDGTIILSFRVTQEKEMEELIKKWIPYMKVLEPFTLKQSIENELKVYLGLV